MLHDALFNTAIRQPDVEVNVVFVGTSVAVEDVDLNPNRDCVRSALNEEAHAKATRIAARHAETDRR